jgi:hypothetical protein
MSIMPRFLERERGTKRTERKSKRKRGCGAGGCEICQNNGNCNKLQR